MLITSFNVRYDEPKDGKHRLKQRLGLILNSIQKNQPDIIGFQELEVDMLTVMQGALANYHIVGCGREANLNGESTAIAYSKDKFQLLATRTFWLSPHPDQPGSRFLIQSICPRTCTTVLLRVKHSGELMRIYNTHLDHLSRWARRRGLQEIIKQIFHEALLPETPVVVMGDFNAYPSEGTAQLLTAQLGLVELTAEIQHTFHDFGKRESLSKIDYIFASPSIEFTKTGIYLTHKPGHYLSDHHPIFANINIKQGEMEEL